MGGRAWQQRAAGLQALPGIISASHDGAAPAACLLRPQSPQVLPVGVHEGGGRKLRAAGHRRSGRVTRTAAAAVSDCPFPRRHPLCPPPASPATTGAPSGSAPAPTPTAQVGAAGWTPQTDQSSGRVSQTSRCPCLRPPAAQAPACAALRRCCRTLRGCRPGRRSWLPPAAAAAGCGRTALWVAGAARAAVVLATAARRRAPLEVGESCALQLAGCRLRH